jgi:hypothetical protein
MKYFWGLLFCCFFATASAETFIKVTPQEALAIGVKIWYNECSGSVAGLTSWSDGENFASLGVGHFIWYPYGKPHVYSESFPELIHYMEQHGVTVPRWLQGNWTPYCPWNNRSEFIAAQYSPHMIELREFLLHTIPIQTQFIISRMETALPKMLASVPTEERPYIERQFYRIAATPLGVYALVDYVNFKGIGVTSTGQYDENGWGLLEVIEQMKSAPDYMTPLQAFSWAANMVLTRRVENEPSYYHEWQWLTGWRNRLKTYLD